MQYQEALYEPSSLNTELASNQLTPNEGESKMDDKSEVIEMTADIVAAYVGSNSVAAAIFLP